MYDVFFHAQTQHERKEEVKKLEGTYIPCKKINYKENMSILDSEYRKILQNNLKKIEDARSLAYFTNIIEFKLAAARSKELHALHTFIKEKYNNDLFNSIEFFPVKSVDEVIKILLPEFRCKF